MTQTKIDIRLITTLAEWSEIQEQWDQLLQSVPGATALQSYRFLQCWWRHFGHNKQLRIIVASENGRLVGGAPLQLARRRIYRKEYRVLEFLGMPDELDRPHFLVAENDDRVIALLLDKVEQLGKSWDLIQLDEMDTTGWQVNQVIDWARRMRLQWRTDPLHPVPYLEKDGTWADFLDGKSRRFGKRLRYMKRRLERDHKLTYRWSHGPRLHAELLYEFLAIEGKSWKAQKGYDVGSDVGYRDFYAQLLANDGDEMRGHIVVQYIDGVPSAATFGFSSLETYYSLQIAHDQEFDRYSPGTLLEAFEMQWFFDNPELQRYELLGGEGRNKDRWASDSTDTCIVLVYRPNLRFAAASIYRYLRGLIRRES